MGEVTVISATECDGRRRRRAETLQAASHTPRCAAQYLPRRGVVAGHGKPDFAGVPCEYDPILTFVSAIKQVWYALGGETRLPMSRFQLPDAGFQAIEREPGLGRTEGHRYGKGGGMLARPTCRPARRTMKRFWRSVLAMTFDAE
jgi:hypothetical protein